MPPLPPSAVKKTAAKKTLPTPSKAAATTKKLPAKKVAGAVKKSASDADLPDQIVPVGTGVRKYPAILIYGPPGTGKTVMAGTAPNCLILEADDGDISAKVAGSKAKKWRVRDYDDMAEAIYWLQNGGAEKFDYIALDTISMFQTNGLHSIMEDLVAHKPNRLVWAPDKGEYGQNMNRLLRALKDLAELPCGLIVTAHILEEVDHEGESRFMPAIQGKNMPEKVCVYFDIVGHMSTKVHEGKEIPRFSTLKEGKYYTKDRYKGRVGALMDPSIPKILRRIEAPQG